MRTYEIIPLASSKLYDTGWYDEYDCYCEGLFALEDGRPVDLLYRDGGEPEDQCLGRDLNKLAFALIDTQAELNAAQGLTKNNLHELPLCCLDIETSGLDPERDQILEVAFKYCTRSGELGFENCAQAVLPLRDDPSTWHESAREMHTANGLIKEVSALKEEGKAYEAELHHLDNLFSAALTGEKYTLVGNSVHFDLGFLRRHMPKLARKFNYRLGNVSSVRVFLETVGYQEPNKNVAHRAMDDVDASLDMLRRFQSLVRVVP